MYLTFAVVVEAERLRGGLGGREDIQASRIALRKRHKVKLLTHNVTNDRAFVTDIAEMQCDFVSKPQKSLHTYRSH